MKNNNIFKKNFSFDKYTLINFVSLNREEKKKILIWRNHEAVRKWSYNDKLINSRQHNKFLKNLNFDNQQFFWLVKNTGLNEYIGVVSLKRIDYNNKNAFLGIYVNPQISGVGSLLLQLLKKVVFDYAKFHTLKLEVITDNTKAINLYTKFGFTKEGNLKEFIKKENEWKDVLIMGLINRISA